jgi:hypothetical protein
MAGDLAHRRGAGDYQGFIYSVCAVIQVHDTIILMLTSLSTAVTQIDPQSLFLLTGGHSVSTCVDDVVDTRYPHMV